MSHDKKSPVAKDLVELKHVEVKKQEIGKDALDLANTLKQQYLEHDQFERLNNNEISDAFQIISDATGWSIFQTEQVSRARISLWAEDITAGQLLDTIVTLAGFIYHRETHKRL